MFFNMGEAKEKAMIGKELLRVVGGFRWVWDKKPEVACNNECGITRPDLFDCSNFLCGQIPNLPLNSSSCLDSKTNNNIT